MILLDTNVVSELMKAKPHGSVEHWFLFAEDDCHLPTVAVGEIAFGIARLAEGARKAKLSEQLAEWRIRYADRTFLFGTTTAMVYGDVMADAQRAGRPMSVPDGQIAAIAIEHGAMLATRNGSDFVTTGLTLIDPWL